MHASGLHPKTVEGALVGACGNACAYAMLGAGKMGHPCGASLSLSGTLSHGLSPGVVSPGQDITGPPALGGLRLGGFVGAGVKLLPFLCVYF